MRRGNRTLNPEELRQLDASLSDVERTITAVRSLIWGSPKVLVKGGGGAQCDVDYALNVGGKPCAEEFVKQSGGTPCLKKQASRLNRY